MDEAETAIAQDAEVGRRVNEVIIGYSVKELLSSINDKLAAYGERMNTLATKAEVEKLETAVEQLQAWKNRVIGASLVIGALSGGGMAWLYNLLSQGGT